MGMDVRAPDIRRVYGRSIRLQYLSIRDHAVGIWEGLAQVGDGVRKVGSGRFPWWTGLGCSGTRVVV